MTQLNVGLKRAHRGPHAANLVNEKMRRASQTFSIKLYDVVFGNLYKYKILCF